MTSARQRVFGTPELVEAILVQLTPPNHLLLAQLVSWSFRTAITSSPRLQQLLFFRPAPPRDPSTWNLNPLLREHFVPWFVMPAGRHSFTMPEYESLQMLDWMGLSKRDVFLRADASWRNMLLVQPPPRYLTLVCLSHGMGGDYERKAVYEQSEGITMGTLYDITESFLRRNPVSRFGLAITNTDTTPEITVFLMYTQQCCPEGSKDDYMTSLGATLDIAASESIAWSAHRRLDRSGSQHKGPRTDLTPDKGGVDENAWEEWKRQRDHVLDDVSERRRALRGPLEDEVASNALAPRLLPSRSL